MKKHKIPNVAINICCAEQKIADNFLFSWSDFAKRCGVVEGLEAIKADILRHEKITKKYNINLIFSIICENIEKYISYNVLIFSSYEEIGTFYKIPDTITNIL